MRTLSILILFFLLSGICKAQHERVVRTIAPKSELQNAYAISYFAPFVTNPGLRGEYQLALQKIQKEIKYSWLDYFLGNTQKYKVKIRIKERLFTNGVAFYYDHKNHKACVLTSGYSVRKHKRHMFTERSIGIGLMRTFLPTTYAVSDNGDIEKLKFAGNFMFTPYYSFGISFKDRKRENAEFFLRGSAYFYIPYNHAFNINGIFEAGYRISLK